MKTTVTKTRPRSQLSLKDRLSHLSFSEASKVLGPRGKQLIQQNANAWEFRLQEDVFLGEDLFRLRFPELGPDRSPVIVTVTLMAEARNRLHWNCTACRTACEHVGAAFSLILEEKLALGLAAAPQPRLPVEIHLAGFNHSHCLGKTIPHFQTYLFGRLADSQ